MKEGLKSCDGDWSKEKVDVHGNERARAKEGARRDDAGALGPSNMT